MSHTGSRRSATRLYNTALNPIEQLEPRTYFDLVPTTIGTIPLLVSTLHSAASIPVTIQNTGGASIKGPYTITLLASPDGQLGDATVINVKNEVLLPLPAGKSRVIKVPVGTVPALTNGSYNILAEVGGTLSNVNDNVFASANQVTIDHPFIDLITSTAFTGLTSFKPGGTVHLNVTITNIGNITAKGAVAIQIGTSVNANGSSPDFDVSPVKNVNLAPGKHQTFPFSQKVPVGFTPGTYYAVDHITSFNIVESDTTNNTGVSPNIVTILDPFKVITGVWAGPFHTTKGAAAGDSGTITLTVNTESDISGAITGTGINSLGGPTFSFTGDITTAGNVTFHTSNTSNALSTVFSGKIVGTKFTGTFHGNTGESGNFNFTFQ